MATLSRRSVLLAALGTITVGHKTSHRPGHKPKPTPTQPPTNTSSPVWLSAQPGFATPGGLWPGGAW